MPHKFNASRRYKIVRQKFKLTNCSAYNESLRQRGDLTVWVNDEALCLWSAARRTDRSSRGETQMGRWKTVIGSKLQAKEFKNQKNRSQEQRPPSQPDDGTWPSTIPRSHEKGHG